MTSTLTGHQGWFDSTSKRNLDRIDACSLSYRLQNVIMHVRTRYFDNRGQHRRAPLGGFPAGRTSQIKEYGGPGLPPSGGEGARELLDSRNRRQRYPETRQAHQRDHRRHSRVPPRSPPTTQLTKTSLKHLRLTLRSHGTSEMTPTVVVEHKEAAKGQPDQDKENEQPQTRYELSRIRGNIMCAPVLTCGCATLVPVLAPVRFCSPKTQRDDEASTHSTPGAHGISM